VHAAALDPLEQGSVVAGYRIVRPLGASDGRYRAYEAIRPHSELSVALKLIEPRLAGTPAFRERFLRDLLLQAPLRNPHVIRVLDGGTSEHGLYLVTRRVPPLTLAQLMDERVEPDRVMRLLVPVGDALDAAHELGLIHGSLQPSSIRIAGRDDAFVDDFCLSGAGGPWTAPEQARGGAPTVAGDVYALAAVAATCLAARRPSRDGRMPRVPPPFDAPLRRALSAESADRPRSAGELMRALVAAGSAASPAPTPARPRRPPKAARAARSRPRATSRRRHPFRRVHLNAAGVTLAVLAAVTGFLVAPDRPAPAPAPAPATPTVVGSPLLGLTIPGDWRVAPAPPVRPGLEYAEPPVTLAPRTSEGVALVAGRVDADAPTFVPASLPPTLDGGLPRPELVTLGDVGALRYRALRPTGEDVVIELYAVPTTAGPVSLTCTADVTSVGLLEACRRVAATLSIRGAEPLELKPDAEYGEAVAAILGRLVAARKQARARLAAEGSQAREAAALARAFTAARTGLAKTTPPEVTAPVHRGILAALDGAAKAYERLSAAAERRDRAGFGRATRLVAEGEDGVRRALQDLEILGYAVG
jgi:hypothetical protein